VRLERRPLVDYRQHGGNEIGAAAPTLRYKISRVLEGGGAARTARLAERAEILAKRLRRIGADPALTAEAEAKARFEAERAARPRVRLARAPGVARRLASGGYARFASRGALDAVRDLLGRAG
jgi:hypothetical protein